MALQVKAPLIILFVVFLYLFVLSPANVLAAEKNIFGYAWSENIGWIKFNGVNYGVKVNDVSGRFSGYAWSENIGWIDFNTGNIVNGLRLNFDNGQVAGLAKTVAGDSVGSGGWDGLIKFDGSSYGVRLIGDATYGCRLEGWAWGSEVTGWIKFGSPAASDRYYVGTTACPFETPEPPEEEEESLLSCNFSASPLTLVFPRRSATLSWSCQNATACGIDNGIGGVNKNSGSVAVDVPVSKTFSLTCFDNKGASRSYSAAIKVLKPVYCEIIPNGPGCQ